MEGGGAEGGGGQTSVQRPALHLDDQGAGAFVDRGRRLHAETAQSALTVTLKLVMRWSDQRPLDCFKHS